MKQIEDLFHWYGSTASFMTHKKLGLIPLDSIAFLGQTGQLYVQGNIIGVSTEEFDKLKEAVDKLTDIFASGEGEGTLLSIEKIINFIEGFTEEERLKDILDKFKSSLDDKVDKVKGKGLSTNDFTNELREKLEGLNPFTVEELTEILI